MRIDLLTLFPGFFASPLDTSILARARRRGQLEVAIHDLRAYAEPPRHQVDDVPYGGGGGMVIKPEPVDRAWRDLGFDEAHTVYLTADGQPLDQDLAAELSLLPRLALLCGHYKGIDERLRPRLDREVSIGDYVLTGGETAALVLIDAVARLLPGVLGNFSSALEDSFHDDLLDCPWYTRPAVFDGQPVPEVLVQGDHAKVQRWRRRQALRRTFERRPELLQQAALDEEERALVRAWKKNAPIKGQQTKTS